MNYGNPNQIIVDDDLLCDYNIKDNIKEQLNNLLVSLPKSSAEYITSVPGEFDINRLLITDIDKNKNVIMFDNKLLGIKINQFGLKPKIRAEEKERLPKYIQESIAKSLPPKNPEFLYPLKHPCQKLLLPPFFFHPPAKSG